MSQNAPAGVSRLNGDGIPDWTRLREVQQVKTELVRGDKKNPRSTSDPSAMQRLINSIKKYGILVPLVGRQGENGQVILMSGHRRLDAARLLHLKAVPVLLVTGKESPSEIRALLLAYNFQEPLPPLDQARLVLEEAADSHTGVQEVAEDYCLEPAEMKKCIAILSDLAAEVQQEVNRRAIPVEAGYLISQVTSQVEQKKLGARWLSGTLSLAALKAAVSRSRQGKNCEHVRTTKSPVKHNAHSRVAEEKKGAEYTYSVPFEVATAAVTISVKCSRGLSEASLDKALRYVLKRHFKHAGEE
jgi:ParB family transcriptional regulator, chromosome partitioning protein